jgi:hypothetical protein
MMESMSSLCLAPSVVADPRSCFRRCLDVCAFIGLYSFLKASTSICRTRSRGMLSSFVEHGCVGP